MKDSGRKDSIKLIIVAIMVTIGIIGVVSYTYSFFEKVQTNSIKDVVEELGQSSDKKEKKTILKNIINLKDKLQRIL